MASTLCVELPLHMYSLPSPCFRAKCTTGPLTQWRRGWTFRAGICPPWAVLDLHPCIRISCSLGSRSHNSLAPWAGNCHQCPVCHDGATRRPGWFRHESEHVGAQGMITDHLVLRGWFQTLPIAVYGYHLAVTPAQQVRSPRHLSVVPCCYDHTII